MPKPVAQFRTLSPRNEEGHSDAKTRAAPAVRAAAAPGRRGGGETARGASHLRRFVCGGDGGGCGRVGGAGTPPHSRKPRAPPGEESRARRPRALAAQPRGLRAPPARAAQAAGWPHSPRWHWRWRCRPAAPGRWGGRGEARETRAEAEGEAGEGWLGAERAREAAAAAPVTRGKSRPGPCVRQEGGGGAGCPATSGYPRPDPRPRDPARAGVAAAQRPRPAREEGGAGVPAGLGVGGGARRGPPMHPSGPRGPHHAPSCETLSWRAARSNGRSTGPRVESVGLRKDPSTLNIGICFLFSS